MRGAAQPRPLTHGAGASASHSATGRITRGDTARPALEALEVHLLLLGVGDHVERVGVGRRPGRR